MLIASIQAQYELAQATQPSSSDWTSILFQTGVVGVFMFLFLIGRIFAKSTVDDYKEQLTLERNRADNERERADKAIATLQEFAQATELTNRILTEIKNRVERSE